MPAQKKARNQRLKEMLQQERQTLWQKIRVDVFEKLGEDYKAEFDRAQDSADMSTLDVLQSIGIALVDIHQADLTRIVEAERKLDQGTYGTCERCGKEISEQRLKAIPYATHCIECAEILEPASQGRGSTL